MFHSLTALYEIPVITTDGERRPIRNILFDDRTWDIQFLVLDVGRWYAPRQVVIPVSDVEAPDWQNKYITAHLSLEELLSRPDADTVRPVSRQQQLAWSRHFGWPDNDRYWHGPAIDSARREFGAQGSDNPHLRRARDLFTYQIWGSKGYLGLLEGFFLEHASWHVGYLLLRAGDWVYREQIVSTGSVAGISWAQHRVVLEEQKPLLPHGSQSLQNTW